MTNYSFMAVFRGGGEIKLGGEDGEFPMVTPSLNHYSE